MANRGTGTVSLLRFAHSGALAGRTDLAVGAGPVAIAALGGRSFDGGTVGESGFVTANSLSGTLTSVTLDEGARPAATSTTVLPGQSASRPVALSLGMLDRDGKVDVAVADAATHVVYALHGTRRGAFAHATALLSPREPASVLVADIGGDQVRDVIVADRGPDSVLAWTTPATDLRLTPDGATRNLAARSGHALWSGDPAERRIASCMDSGSPGRRLARALRRSHTGPTSDATRAAPS